MMAIVSGAVCIVAGVARLGFVTELLSKPIRYGYMNGIALAVLVSQTPKLIGVKIEEAGPLRDLWSIGAEIVGGRANWVAFALGAATLATILSIRSFKGTPGVLIAVIGADGKPVGKELGLILGLLRAAARAGQGQNDCRQRGVGPEHQDAARAEEGVGEQGDYSRIEAQAPGRPEATAYAIPTGASAVVRTSPAPRSRTSQPASYVLSVANPGSQRIQPVALVLA